MNFEVLILFFNAAFAVVIAAVMVTRILRKEYLPEIRRLENQEISEKKATGEI